MNGYYHSVALQEDKCRGCTNCISNCPTEAIRVRKGKARIILERCIDCGECIRICPSHAKIADTDALEAVQKYDFRVAVPAPSLFGQFPRTITRDHVLTALKRLGFDDVFEVAIAADLVARAYRDYFAKTGQPKPLISSSCPAVVRLIQVRFPSLIEHIVRVKAPMEIAGWIVKNRIHADKRNIGVFFITPCPAKRTSIKSSLSIDSSSVDGAIAARDIYVLLRNIAAGIKVPEKLSSAAATGLGWAGSDGEAASIGLPRTLTVDGIHRVIGVLELMENGGLKDFDLLEAMACPGGCVGGPLNPDNAAAARARIRAVAEETEAGRPSPSIRYEDVPESEFAWEKSLSARSIMDLDGDLETALEKLKEVDRLTANLPGLDCGSCGSPSCRTLAEDIVRGTAQETDCVFILRERIRKLALEMVDLEEQLPPSLPPRSS